jgi:hypothetical protein
LQGMTFMGRLRATINEDGIVLVVIVISCGLCSAALWVLFKSF